MHDASKRTEKDTIMTSEFPAAFEQRVKDELNPVDVDQLYDDMLDDCYSFDSVGGPFASMSPSRVLQEVDPVAYRCGKNDYFDSLSDEYYEIDGELYDVREVDNLKDEWDAEQEDDEDDEACPGCGCVPGDGLTDGCEDPNGCGFYRDQEDK